MNTPIFLSICISLVAACYYSAFILGLTKKNKLSEILYFVGFLLDLLLVVNNFAVNGYVPFVSMFQVLIFLSACFYPINKFIEYIGRKKGFNLYFILASAIVITAPLFMDKNAIWVFPPALRSIWFVPHILVYMISYSLAAVAFLITVCLIFKKDNDEGIVYYIVRALFPFMTCGMFFGAMWANDVWGAFWSFDIKECWSLVSWLVFMLYLHFYRRKELRKYCKYFAVIGFIAVVITFLFANVIGENSIHSYS